MKPKTRIKRLEQRFSKEEQNAHMQYRDNGDVIGIVWVDANQIDRTLAVVRRDIFNLVTENGTLIP